MVILGILVFGGLAYAAYFGMKEAEDRNDSSKRLHAAKMMGAPMNSLQRVALLDTRRSDGRDTRLYCNLKGVH